ncbi:MAG TPA: hypothetical protein HA256_07720 [Methanoregulaceae archaeon]|jgi:hypothetical protein|nr:hypothetical protein [Methanoregulaceae archaeon]
MAQTLSSRDMAILEKLAPELCDPLCPGSGHRVASVLPPASNHASRDDTDFLHRIEQLSPDELAYLADLIIEGRESINCVRAEHIVLFGELVAEKISRERAERIISIYASDGACGQEASTL